MKFGSTVINPMPSKIKLEFPTTQYGQTCTTV